MKIFIVDTNVILRFFLNDIPVQSAKAETYFKDAQNKKIRLIVPTIVIFEIMFVLEKYYLLGKEQSLKLTRAIVTADYLEIEDRDVFLKALKSYENTNIDFVDIFLHHKALVMGGKVFSFDRDYNKLN